MSWLATTLKPESKLIIPIPPGKHAATEDGATYARHTTRYRVRRGDTVQTVADNFSLPPTMIRRWNHLRGDSLRGRRIVYVHLPVTPTTLPKEQPGSSKPQIRQDLPPASPKTVQRHKVQPGETLISIATTHHTTVEALKRDNGNLPMLRPGMVILIRSVRYAAAGFWHWDWPGDRMPVRIREGHGFRGANRIALINPFIEAFG